MFADQDRTCSFQVQVAPDKPPSDPTSAQPPRGTGKRDVPGQSGHG